MGIYNCFIVATKGETRWIEYTIKPEDIEGIDVDGTIVGSQSYYGCLMEDKDREDLEKHCSYFNLNNRSWKLSKLKCDVDVYLLYRWYTTLDL